MSVVGPLDKSLLRDASGCLGAMPRCSQLRTFYFSGPGLRDPVLSNPRPCPLSKLPYSMRPALFFAGSFMAETVARRLGCFHVINSVSGRLLEATAFPLHSWRRQTNVRSCEQSWMPFVRQGFFHTEQCIHWRGSNLFCLHGNVRGVAAPCLLRQCNSREFAAANNANLPPASVVIAAACVLPCHNRFMAFVRGFAEKRSEPAISAPSQRVRSCELLLRQPHEAMTGSFAATISALAGREKNTGTLAHNFA